MERGIAIRPAGVVSVCADATDLERFRVQQGRGADAPLPLVSLLVAVAGRVLRTTTLARSIDVGVALRTTGGFVVPVIRDADRKHVRELAFDIDELERAAESRRLLRRPFGRRILAVAPIDAPAAALVPPLPAVLGVGAIEYTAVFRGGVFEPRRVLPLQLTWDGGGMGEREAVRLASRVAALVEDPLRLLFHARA